MLASQYTNPTREPLASRMRRLRVDDQVITAAVPGEIFLPVVDHVVESERLGEELNRFVPVADQEGYLSDRLAQWS